MNYADVDNGYVSLAIERITWGLERATRIPVLVNPPPEQADKTSNSFWAVGAVLMQNADQAADLSTQTWSVASILIWKVNQEKYDATIYSAMYSLVPKVFNFMQAHRRLIFQDGQTPPPYLDGSRVQVGLNSINQAGQPGFSIVHRLPFVINIDEEL